MEQTKGAGLRGARGWGRARAASAPPSLTGRPLLPRHRLSSPRGVCGWRQRGREPGHRGERCARLLPRLFLLLPPPPRALLPCKVESGVDVSESTWYRGWRIKSVELNSCHCSDSSRAERRGSERSDEQVSGARRAGERGREARPGETARPGAGAGEGVQSGAAAAARAAGPRPSQHRLSWKPAGRAQATFSPQVSEPLRNSGGESATGSLFSAPFLKGGNRSFSRRAAFLFALLFFFFFALSEIGGPPRPGRRDPPGSCSFFNFQFLIGPAVPAGLRLRAGAGGRAQGRDPGTRGLLEGGTGWPAGPAALGEQGRSAARGAREARFPGCRRLPSAPATVGEKPGSED